MGDEGVKLKREGEQRGWRAGWPLVVFYLVVVVVVTVMYWGREESQDPRHWWEQAIFWGAVAWLVGGKVMILLHELAHAVVGWAVEMEVLGIALGHGERVWRMRIGRWFLDIHQKPWGGLCFTNVRQLEGYRWRKALMVAAGPTVHVVALLVIGAIWSMGAVDSGLGQGVCWGLFLWNARILIRGLIPSHGRWNGMPVRSDGGKLLDLWRGITIDEDVFVRIKTLTEFGDEGKWEEVQRAGREYLKEHAWGSQALSGIEAWVAVADVWMGGEGDLKEAEEFSVRCMEIAGEDPAVKTVRACVLLGVGRDEEAERLLVEAGKGRLSRSAEKAAAHLWAELYRRRGEEEKVREWEGVAKRVDPTGVYRMIRERVESGVL